MAIDPHKISQLSPYGERIYSEALSEGASEEQAYAIAEGCDKRERGLQKEFKRRLKSADPTHARMEWRLLSLVTILLCICTGVIAGSQALQLSPPAIDILSDTQKQLLTIFVGAAAMLFNSGSSKSSESKSSDQT